MVVDFILVAVAIIWLVAASISDIKTKEVPDWLSYSLIIIAFTLIFLKSYYLLQYSLILYSLVGFLIFFLLSYLMYRTKQWGGGDAKLLMGMGALFATYPGSLLNYFNPKLNLPFLLILLFNLLIIGALYGLIYGLTLAIKSKKKFSGEIKKYKIKKAFLFLPIILLAISLMTNLIEVRFLLLSLALFTLILPYLIIFTKIIEKVAMIKSIKVEDLTEGDWIIKNIYYKKRLLYNKKSPGVTKNQIRLMKKYKIKKVIIKEGIPFTPTFLIALIVSLIFGNLLPF